MDFITELPRTAAGYDTLLVVVDKLSKMCHLIPTDGNLTVERLAPLFFTNVIRLHGWPTTIVSDRDKLFTSKLWEALSALYGTHLARSSAFHPQTDGQTERYNRILEDMLRNYVCPDMNDWDHWLPCVEFAINNSYVQGIGTTPFFLNSGRHPRTPLHVALAGQLAEASAAVHAAPREERAEAAGFAQGRPAAVPAATTHAQRIQDGVARARRLLTAANDRMKAYADKRRSEVSFEVGQQLWLSTKNLKFESMPTKKFGPRWIGPMLVEQRVGPVAYRLKLLPGMERLHDVFHCSLLRPYVGDLSRPPPIVTLAGEEVYEVDSLMDHRKAGKNIQFLVKWADPTQASEWVSVRDLSCPEVLRAYWTFRGELTKAKKVKKRQKIR